MSNNVKLNRVYLLIVCVWECVDTLRLFCHCVTLSSTCEILEDGDMRFRISLSAILAVRVSYIHIKRMHNVLRLLADLHPS